MNKPGTLLHCDEAVRLIESITDPVTKTLVNMAFVHFVMRAHLEKRDCLRSDMDMLFLVASLQEFFAKQELLERALRGERVGSWFEDEPLAAN